MLYFSQLYNNAASISLAGEGGGMGGWRGEGGGMEGGGRRDGGGREAGWRGGGGGCLSIQATIMCLNQCDYRYMLHL